MKDKEKQIEEMAKDILSAYGVNKLYSNQVAEYLYNAGYRKLPKDSVVLSREEYKLLFDIKKKFETADGDEITAVSLLMWLKELTARERKETAEKWKVFIKSLFNDGWFTVADNEKVHKVVDEFAKQFGVEIKEKE